MKTLAEVKKILQANMTTFREKYRVTSLGIFGSYARGEQSEDSDVDILIDYEKAPPLSKLVELRIVLSELTGLKVDLVTKNGLNPRIQAHVFADVIYL
ncbi:MAG: nucleotidyltransferase family protein [Cyanobacteria bacterium P01_A01_bin.116]